MPPPRKRDSAVRDRVAAELAQLRAVRPVEMWTVVNHGLHLIPATVSPTRRGAIGYATALYGSWPTLRAIGWRCIRVRVAPVVPGRPVEG